MIVQHCKIIKKYVHVQDKTLLGHLFEQTLKYILPKSFSLISRHEIETTTECVNTTASSTDAIDRRESKHAKAGENVDEAVSMVVQSKDAKEAMHSRSFQLVLLHKSQKKCIRI